MDIQLTLWVEGVRFSIELHDGFVNLRTSNLSIEYKDRILPPEIAAFKDYGLPVLLTNLTYSSGCAVSYAIAGHCDLPKIQAVLARMGALWEI